MRAIVLVVMLGIVSIAPAAYAQQTSLQQRADAAGRVVTRVMAQYTAGTSTIDEVGAWLERWYKARQDAGARAATLLAAAQDWSTKAHALETTAKSKVAAGLAPTTDADKAMFFRLEADGELARLRGTSSFTVTY